VRRELWWFEVEVLLGQQWLPSFLSLSFSFFLSDFWRVEWLNEARNVSIREPKGKAKVGQGVGKA
jgi:hypothetical protein